MTGCNADTAHRRPPSRSFRTIRNCTSGILFTLIPLAGFAGNSDSLSTLTHRQFVDSALMHLAGRTLSEFTPNRSEPLVILKDSAVDQSSAFVDELAALLTRLGVLIRSEDSDSDSAGGWTLRFNLDPHDLSLTDPHRRTFLGPTWLRRNFHVGATVFITEESTQEQVWGTNVDTTYSDWILKRDSKRLADPDHSPPVPVTGWDKAKPPLVAAGVTTALGILFFSLR